MQRALKRLWRRVARARMFIAGIFVGILASVAIYSGYMAHLKAETALAYRSQGVTISWLPQTVTRFTSEINTQAKRYNIDANAIAIIMTLESGGFVKANSGQAEGLLQVTPATARDIAARYVKVPIKTYDLYDVNTSIEFGAAYLAELRQTFCDYSSGPSWNDCMELIAAGYNGGPSAANSLFKGNGLADVQTATYARNALNMWRERAARPSPTYDRWLAAGGQSLVDQATQEEKTDKH